jgi:hypothetical protein
MIMGREWLKGKCWIDTQIKGKSLRSRLRCAIWAQEWIVVAAAGLWMMGCSISLERGGFNFTRARGKIKRGGRVEPH